MPVCSGTLRPQLLRLAQATGSQQGLSHTLSSFTITLPFGMVLAVQLHMRPTMRYHDPSLIATTWETGPRLPDCHGISQPQRTMCWALSQSDAPRVPKVSPPNPGRRAREVISRQGTHEDGRAARRLSSVALGDVLPAAGGRPYRRVAGQHIWTGRQIRVVVGLSYLLFPRPFMHYPARQSIRGLVCRLDGPPMRHTQYTWHC